MLISLGDLLEHFLVVTYQKNKEKRRKEP